METWEALELLPEDAVVVRFDQLQELQDLNLRLKELRDMIAEAEGAFEAAVSSRDAFIEEAHAKGLAQGFQDFLAQIGSAEGRLAAITEREAACIATYAFDAAASIVGDELQSHPQNYATFIAKIIREQRAPLTSLRITFPPWDELRDALHDALERQGIKNASLLEGDTNEVLIDHSVGRIVCSPRAILIAAQQSHPAKELAP